MNKTLSHFIIQILIIVLGFLGVSQALPGLCAIDCACCPDREVVESPQHCPESMSDSSGAHQHGTQDTTHCSVSAGQHGKHQPLQADDAACPPAHAAAGVKTVEGCDDTTICTIQADAAATKVSLATTGGQHQDDTGPALAYAAAVLHVIPDFDGENINLRPYQVPVLTPPLIYNKNCSFLI